MRTQVCYASTGFGLAVVAAALTDRVLPAADRRVLVVSNNAVIPETAYGAADLTGAAALLEMFDDVYSYNDAIAPQHPSMWQPRDIDLPIWERSLRSLWSLEGDLHLVLANLHVQPALTLCQAFTDATIDVYADGLMGYGPTRSAVPAQVGTRVQRCCTRTWCPASGRCCSASSRPSRCRSRRSRSAGCSRRSGSRPTRPTWTGLRGRRRFCWPRT